MAGIGALSRFFAGRLFSDRVNVFQDGSSGDPIIIEGFGSQQSGLFSDLAANNPLSIMGTFILGIGILVIIAGIVLSLVLKKRSTL